MKWEYRQLEVKVAGSWTMTPRLPDQCFDELNRLGQEGWEVIHVIPMARPGGRTDYVTFILRRELQQ